MGRFLSWLLLFIAVGVSVFFRLGTAYLPGLHDAAKEGVSVSFIHDARKAMEEKFSEFSPRVKARLAAEMVSVLDRDKNKAFSEAIRNKENEMRSEFQNESGETFLLEIDSYHWMRLVRNLIQYGRVGDTVINGRQYDTLMLAPIGMEAGVSLHKNLQVYLNYYIFKAQKALRADIPLARLLFYMPIAVTCAVLIAVFLFGLSIETSRINICGVIAALTLGLSPIFLQRSLAGWLDTDPYILLFSLSAAWTFYLSLKEGISLKKRLSFVFISGLIIGLFSFTWNGWWYIFDLILLAAVFHTLNLYSVRQGRQTDSWKLAPWFALALFFLSSFIFVGLLCGVETFTRFIFEPLRIALAKGYLKGHFWPNTFLTVQELRPANIKEVINNCGGWFVFLPALFSLFFMLLDKKQKDYRQRQFIVFLFVFWIMAVSLASIKAVRFSLLLAVPISISFGVLMERIIIFLEARIGRLFKFTRIKEVLLFVSFYLLVSFLSDRAFLLRNALPLMNRHWWALLEEVRVKTPKEAILNSWWDYGHWFKAVAERRVLFDGATQDTPVAYWMGRALLTDSEVEAAGILRMLNSGSNKAFEKLNGLGIDKLTCLKILNDIITRSEPEARRILSGYITDSDAGEIIRYTHRPQPAYFIVEPSLISKMRPISFLGSWDFQKALIYQEFRELDKADFIDYLVKELHYDKDEAVKIHGKLIFLNKEDSLSWISSYSHYYHESFSWRKEGRFLFFDNGFLVDLSLNRIYFWDGQQSSWRIPGCLYSIEGDRWHETLQPKADMELGVLLIKDKNQYKIVSLDRRLTKSMLTRLYYLKGRGLRYFKPFIVKELGPGKGKIIVYEINWMSFAQK
ncbi:MAG: STT3 domain-containing protein [Candidatus Omnitrophota bacterium]